MMEAVVDAHGSSERAMGWYYYLDDKLSFRSGRGAGSRVPSPV